MTSFGVWNYLMFALIVAGALSIPATAVGRSIEPEADSSYGAAGAVALPDGFKYTGAPLVFPSGRSLVPAWKGPSFGAVAIDAAGHVESSWGAFGFVTIPEECSGDVRVLGETNGDPSFVCYRLSGYRDLVTYRITSGVAREVDRISGETWRAAVMPEGRHVYVHRLLDQGGVKRLLVSATGVRTVVATIPISDAGVFNLGARRSLELPTGLFLPLEGTSTLAQAFDYGDDHKNLTVGGLDFDAEGTPRQSWQIGPASIPNPPGEDTTTPGPTVQMTDGSAMYPRLFGSGVVTPSSLAAAGGRAGHMAFLTNGSAAARMVDIAPDLASGAYQGRMFDVSGFGDRYTVRWASLRRDSELVSTTMHLRTFALSGAVIDDASYHVDFLDMDHVARDRRGRTYRRVHMNAVDPSTKTFLIRSCSDDPKCGGYRGGRNSNGTAGRDVLVGTFQRDRLQGRAGPDLLVAGLGRDTLYAGHGDDLVRARDYTRDLIDCGPGHDIAVVDSIDVTRNCEIKRTR